MKFYLVGGTIRRHLLGLDRRTDADFAVETPSYLDMYESVRDDYNGIIWQERERFVCLRARADFLAGAFGGLLVGGYLSPTMPRDVIRVNADFTLCRAETQYSDLRHPDMVTPCSIFEDLSRRDFTVNAMAMSEDGILLDPFSGQVDAAARQLRCVGNARERFEEDPLRMLRAIRFAVTEGMWFNDALHSALRTPTLVELLKTVKVERVREELHKALAFNWRETMLHLMVDEPMLGDVLHEYFPNLWLKPTLESR
jgi:tRNA nucleotidyltransferase/poly(A) polymerase